MDRGILFKDSSAYMASRRKVTGNLKLVHEMYGPKAPHIPQEEFKRDFADAIAYNDEIDKHFNKVPSPVHSPAHARRQPWQCSLTSTPGSIVCSILLHCAGVSKSVLEFRVAGLG